MRDILLFGTALHEVPRLSFTMARRNVPVSLIYSGRFYIA